MSNATFFWNKPFDENEWAVGEVYPGARVLRDFDEVDVDMPDDVFEMPEGRFVSSDLLDDYYDTLPDSLKDEFKKLFIDKSEQEKANQAASRRLPKYVINGDNTVFFQLAFIYSSTFAKVISIELLENFYSYLYKKFEDNPYLRTRLNDGLIRIYYVRRLEGSNLRKCEAKCREDIAYNLEHVAKFEKLHSYKRLVMILENSNRLEEAKVFCEQAIALNLDDGTKAGYAGRLEKILKKI